MTTLRVCVQKQRSDGYYPVYIRVIHGRQSGFIKTDKMVDRKSVTKTREIRDNMVLKYCTELISEYNAKLNMQDTSQWSVKEIISFLTTDQSDASFSEYAKLHINRMINSGHERNAKNYKLAVASLEQYMGTNKIMFSYLTSVTLKKWIDHLAKKMRAKEMYPVCVRQIFKAALVELNDEERGVIRIKFNPWLKVQIPKSDKAEQRAISAEACREFFNRPLPQTKMISSLPELGRDVAKLVLCLGGINTVDLFYMKKSNYKNGVIGYNRAKTRHSRSDEAYIEMRVEPFIQPVFDKYLADDDDEFLFNFHLRYCDSDSFSANVNNGIRKICKDNALVASDRLYIPLTAEALPMKGLAMLDDVVNEVRRRVNPSLELGGVFFTRFNNRNLNKEVVKMIESRYADKVFKTKIRENITLAEMPLSGQSIFEYDAKSNGAVDYMALTEEIIAREDK